MDATYSVTLSKLKIDDLEMAVMGKPHERNRIATLNNVIGTNYMKVKIDYKEKINKCRSFGDSDETVTYIINEYSKLAPKNLVVFENWSTRNWARDKSLTILTNGKYINQNLF